MKCQQPIGISFIEFMVSTCVASFLLSGVWQIVVIGNRTYREVNHQLVDAFDETVVESLLRDRVHHAGFTPCVALDHLVTVNEHGEALRAFHLEDPKQVTFNRMGSDFHSVQLLNNQQLAIEGAFTFSKNKHYVIADCHYAEQVTVVKHRMSSLSQVIELERPLRFTYRPPIYFGEWLSETFKLSETKGLLYRSQHADVLSSEIQQMTIKLITHAGKQVFRIGLKNKSGLLTPLVISRRMV